MRRVGGLSPSYADMRDSQGRGLRRSVMLRRRSGRGEGGGVGTAVAKHAGGGGGPWFDVAKPLFSKAPTCVDGV